MNQTRKRLTQRLVAYSCAAGAALGLVGSAEARVQVYDNGGLGWYDDAYAIGGPYGVALPEPVKLDYVYIPEGLTVRFTVLVDKNAGEMDHSGEITALAESAAEIRTDTRLERLTNLKLALYRDGAEFSAELFGKVIGNGGGDDDPTLLVTFTQMPDDVATLLQTLRTTAAGTGAP